jgi:hypothetical protein
MVSSIGISAALWYVPYQCLLSAPHPRPQNPAFGPLNIRELTDIFVSKSIEVRSSNYLHFKSLTITPQLRDKWTNIASTSPNETINADVLPWFNRLTLDIIGLAGFNYSFDSLEDKPNELAEAFSEAFSSDKETKTILSMLQGYIPALRFIVCLRLVFNELWSSSRAYQPSLQHQNRFFERRPP